MFPRIFLVTIVFFVFAKFDAEAEDSYRILAVNRADRSLARHPVVVRFPAGILDEEDGVEVEGEEGVVPSQLGLEMVGDHCQRCPTTVLFQADFDRPGGWRAYTLRIRRRADADEKTQAGDPPEDSGPLSNGIIEITPGRGGAFFSSAASIGEDKRLYPFFSFVRSHKPAALKDLEWTRPLRVTERGPVRWSLEASGFNPTLRVGWHKRVSLWAGRSEAKCEILLKNTSEKRYGLGRMIPFQFLPEPGGRLTTNVREYGKDHLWYWKNEWVHWPILPPRGRWQVLWERKTDYWLEDTECDGPNRSVLISLQSRYPVHTILYNNGTGKPQEIGMDFMMMLTKSEGKQYPTLSPSQTFQSALWIQPSSQKATTFDPRFPSPEDVEVFIRMDR